MAAMNTSAVAFDRLPAARCPGAGFESIHAPQLIGCQEDRVTGPRCVLRAKGAVAAIRFVFGGLCLAGVAGPMASASAQDIDAGKTPAQLYAASCVLCHKKPQDVARAGVARGEGFLRQHYTTGKEEAAMMAAY